MEENIYTLNSRIESFCKENHLDELAFEQFLFQFFSFPSMENVKLIYSRYLSISGFTSIVESFDKIPTNKSKKDIAFAIYCQSL